MDIIARNVFIMILCLRVLYSEATDAVIQRIEKETIMDLLKLEQRYHLSCPSCGKDWWDDNPFPFYCPYCNTNRIPERKESKELKEVLHEDKIP